MLRDITARIDDDPATDDPVDPMDDPASVEEDSGGLRLVVLDPAQDGPLHAGRASVRRAALAMTPVDGVTPVPDEPGAARFLWTLVSPDDLTLAISARSFASAARARSHARGVIDGSRPWRLCPVRNEATGHRSMWIAVGGTVEILAGQAWAERSAERNGQTWLRRMGLGRDEATGRVARDRDRIVLP
ncbi:hypothetical protein GCM10027064_25710 [Microbacterium petrolearium]